ncbi:MAG TPA: hypothetical protein VF418_05050 [Sphingomonadaceae bacterium]
MATANRARTGGPRIWPRLLLGFVVLVAGLGWYYHADVMARAVAGTAYGARVGCSCRFVGGRSLGDCRKDFEPGMSMVRLSEDREAKSVTASVPLLASATATYRAGFGCVLEPWPR